MPRRTLMSTIGGSHIDMGRMHGRRVHSVRQAARLVLLSALFWGGASASAHAQGSMPEGWKMRLDRDAGADLSFVSMPPGWHITTGPAAIFYDPAQTASGQYRLEADIFLFDPGSRAEGYGILFGGSDLEGTDQSYTYFLLRRDGRYLVKKREGSSTSIIQDWTAHPAIVTWEERGEGEAAALNVLAVQVNEKNVIFQVNGRNVVLLSPEEMPTDGIVGLRVNHGLDLHVRRLEVIPSGS